jgi:hypothetical protein
MTSSMTAGKLVSMVALTATLAACDTGGHPAPAAPAPASQTPAGPATPAPSVVPGAPVFDCGAKLPAIQLQLPCAIGLPLAGRASVVECPVAGTANNKLSFVLDLAGAAGNGNEVGSIPVLGIAPPQDGPIASNGRSFSFKTLRGTAAFSSVDVEGRALLGRFVDAELVLDAAGIEIVCKSRDSLFWAVPGNFL